MRSGPLRHKWFALFTGTITSGSIGDEVMRLALPLLVLDLTHDIGAAAILRVVETIPYVLFGAFAGALIDRSDKRRLLLVTTILVEHAGTTTLTMTSLFPSQEVRDMLIRSGMTSGATETYDKLAACLASMV